MNKNNIQTTQQLLADIYQQFHFIPPVFLALRETPDVLRSLWQQVYTVYELNPIPCTFKEKLFLTLSYHSHSPYDLRGHAIFLNYLGLQEQDILMFLHQPSPTLQEMQQHLLFLHTQPPLTDWSLLDKRLEHVLLNCTAHMFFEKNYAEECRVELQHMLGIHYIYLSAFLSVVRLYHHWIEMLQDRLSVGNETFIPQQFARCFTSGGVLERHLHAHYAQCLFERSNKDVQKQAEINERMYEFLSIAGHELKTPLTSIKGNIQLLQRRMDHEQPASPVIEGYTPSDIQAILQRADHQADRLTRLVRDIIEASRIRTSHLSMHMASCDLTQLMQSFFDLQQQQTPQRSISLALPTRAVPVTIDKDYIEEVMVNYLSNALKYSASDKPVKIVLAIENTTTARVSVQDEGPGVALEEQELIWESFYQAKNNAVRSGSSIGLGLGLFISRSIIEAHGGRVGIHSTPKDHGSTFWFSLPLTAPK